MGLTPTKVDYNGPVDLYKKRGKQHTTSLEAFLPAKERTCDSEPIRDEIAKRREEGRVRPSASWAL
jgi:hypothetical protein